ncbi:MAG: DEAD/DEAH box helicase [Gammaproteobacteria bacterium]
MSAELPEQKKLFEALLTFDLAAFAHRLGIANAPVPVTDSAAAALLNLAERLSRSTHDADRQRCLVICGMLWEHRHDEWLALPPFVMNLLSRLGLAPAMRMVSTNARDGDSRLETSGSLRAEAGIEARSLGFEVKLLARTPLVLSEFQHRVWTAMDRGPHVGVSAPTSAGKSFVLLYKALDIIAREGRPVLYVVPTISLIQQVTKDFHAAAHALGLDDVQVHQTYLHDEGITRAIYVLTQERALSALADKNALLDCSLVVIDEVQNIERASDQDEERAHTLFDVVQELTTNRRPKRVVISGPRVENIGQLTQQLLGSDAGSVSQDLPPVVNVTYSFSKSPSGVTLKQWIPGIDASREMRVEDADHRIRNNLGKSLYSDPMMDFMADLLKKVAASEGTLVFSPTSQQATKTALALAGRGKWSRNDEHIESLDEYVDETVHSKYALRDCLQSGVAYHHGKMPHHIRIAVEQAFGALDVHLLTCTTTLMQGVNLPAKNLIARNPHLFVRRVHEAQSLTAYEFANLRGRAGRLLKDFVGRSIVLDETAFEKDELDLDFPEKVVQAGYFARFEENREEIIGMLRTSAPASSEQPNSDLAVYIRQAIYRRGRGALLRLAGAGIIVTDSEYSTFSEQLKALTIPKEICSLAPYWDPLLLDVLYREQLRNRIPLLPSSPFAPGFVDSLVSVLEALKALVPYYYERYVGESSSQVVKSIASMAQRWSVQKPLKEIISWGGPTEDVNWEQIDHRIKRISKQVVHDIPKLLKPLVAMQDPANPILTLMEMGAHEPQVRRLIELGLPRETAIRVRRRLDLGTLNQAPDAALLAAAASVAIHLNRWESAQVAALRGL